MFNYQDAFKECCLLFIWYEYAMTSIMSEEEKYRKDEGFKRLKQLNYIVRKIQILEIKTKNLRDNIKIGDSITPFRNAFDQLNLYTEVFYYFASRLIDSVGEVGKELPGFKNFRKKQEIKNILIVRNHLIEHAYRNTSKIFGGGIHYGEEDGPILKFFRPSTMPQDKRDQGVLKNTRSLLTTLKEMLACFLKTKDKQEERKRKAVETIDYRYFNIWDN